MEINQEKTLNDADNIDLFDQLIENQEYIAENCSDAKDAKFYHALASLIRSAKLFFLNKEQQIKQEKIEFFQKHSHVYENGNTRQLTFEETKSALQRFDEYNKKYSEWNINLIPRGFSLADWIDGGYIWENICKKLDTGFRPTRNPLCGSYWCNFNISHIH